MGGPSIGRDLAEAIGRLGGLRRQMKALETEESVLRQQVMNAIRDWPQEWFPVRVSGYELKRQQRVGKVDGEEAARILSDKGLLAQVKTQPALFNIDSLMELRVDLASKPMPSTTRQDLTDKFEAAIAWQPIITPQDLEEFRAHGHLADAEWLQCFRDLKPVIEVLLVR